MKHTTSIIKLFSLALLLISGYACTGNFDKINQKDYQVDKEELGREGYNVGASLKGLQGLVIPTEEHLYQFVEALAARFVCRIYRLHSRMDSKIRDIQSSYRLVGSSFLRPYHTYLSLLSRLAG